MFTELLLMKNASWLTTGTLGGHGDVAQLAQMDLHNALHHAHTAVFKAQKVDAKCDKQAMIIN